MNINKNVEKIKQKANKYIRQNHSGYFGGDRYLMSIAGYVYFVEGACNEIKQSILKDIMKELNKLMDNKRIKALENNFVMYSRGLDNRHCPMCGAEPRRQKKMIESVIKEVLK